MDLILDGKEMTTIDKLHDEIEKKLDVPGYYGRNLDALYDVLTDMAECAIVLKNAEIMENCCGEYAKKVIKVIKDAEAQNSSMAFRIE